MKPSPKKQKFFDFLNSVVHTSFYLLFLIIFGGIFLIVYPIFAHPGNTDSYGCHTCRTNCSSWGLSYGEYHCHQARGLIQPEDPIRSHYGEGGTGYTESWPDYSYPSLPSEPTCPLMSYYDDLSGSCKCYSGYVASGNKCISKDQWCQDSYGYGATSDYLSDNCKCKYGYVFGKDISGNIKCISGDQVCRDEYGVMSKHNSLSNKCECFSGYVFGEDSIGRTQCISEDEWCQNKYGYNSINNTLTDKCECKSGYEFTAKSGSFKCESCFSKYGLNSSYNYIDKKCECNDGYILENNECVKEEITITCPINSRLIGNQCFCNDGYLASNNSCITYTQNCQNKYGVNSYGDKNNCYCNNGYEWNSSQTNCIKKIETDNNPPVIIMKELNQSQESNDKKDKKLIEKDTIEQKNNSKEGIKQTEKTITKKENDKKEQISTNQKPTPKFWNSIPSYIENLWKKLFTF